MLVVHRFDCRFCIDIRWKARITPSGRPRCHDREECFAPHKIIRLTEDDSNIFSYFFERKIVISKFNVSFTWKTQRFRLINDQYTSRTNIFQKILMISKSTKEDILSRKLCSSCIASTVKFSQIFVEGPGSPLRADWGATTEKSASHHIRLFD